MLVRVLFLESVRTKFDLAGLVLCLRDLSAFNRAKSFRLVVDEAGVSE